jgi:hypothetical protein
MTRIPTNIFSSGNFRSIYLSSNKVVRLEQQSDESSQSATYTSRPRSNPKINSTRDTIAAITVNVNEAEIWMKQKDKVKGKEKAGACKQKLLHAREELSR